MSKSSRSSGVDNIEVSNYSGGLYNSKTSLSGLCEYNFDNITFWSLSLHEYIYLVYFEVYRGNMYATSEICVTCEASVERSTYIGQVTSTSSSTYPSDGYQSSGTGAGYYYVFVG